MTDFRAWGTIMGPAGLTAVFGMGTGVAPPVWSPGSRPGGDQAPAAGWSGGRRAGRIGRRTRSGAVRPRRAGWRRGPLGWAARSWPRRLRGETFVLSWA